MLCNLPLNGYILRRFYLLLMFVSPFFSLAQNKNNYLQATSFNTTYNLSSGPTLETQQVRSNAFQLTIVSKNHNNFNIYGKVSSSTGPNGTGLPPSMFSVRLNSVSPLVLAGYNTYTLTNTDQLIQEIVTIWPFWNTYSTITFNYDLLVGPVGYDYPSGTYLTTILFTMTQP